MFQQPPPLVLVKTWIQMLNSTNFDKQVRARANRMLVKSFGSVELAILYTEDR